jgi:hypothetical protein
MEDLIEGLFDLAIELLGVIFEWPRRRNYLDTLPPPEPRPELPPARVVRR